MVLGQFGKRKNKMDYMLLGILYNLVNVFITLFVVITYTIASTLIIMLMIIVSLYQVVFYYLNKGINYGRV
jgi:hypothetical protein